MVQKEQLIPGAIFYFFRDDAWIEVHSLKQPEAEGEAIEYKTRKYTSYDGETLSDAAYSLCTDKEDLRHLLFDVEFGLTAQRVQKAFANFRTAVIDECLDLGTSLGELATAADEARLRLQPPAPASMRKRQI